MYILFFFSNFLQISTLNFYMRLIPTISVNIMPYMSQLAPMTLMTCPRSISLNPIKPQTAKTVTTNIAIDLIQQLINFFNTKVLYGGMFRYLLFLWLFGLQISWWWVLDVGVFIFLLCLHLFMLLYIHVYVYYGYIQNIFVYAHMRIYKQLFIFICINILDTFSDIHQLYPLSHFQHKTSHILSILSDQSRQFTHQHQQHSININPITYYNTDINTYDPYILYVHIYFISYKQQTYYSAIIKLCYNIPNRIDQQLNKYNITQKHQYNNHTPILYPSSLLVIQQYSHIHPPIKSDIIINTGQSMKISKYKKNNLEHILTQPSTSPYQQHARAQKNYIQYDAGNLSKTSTFKSTHNPFGFGNRYKTKNESKHLETQFCNAKINTMSDHNKDGVNSYDTTNFTTKNNFIAPTRPPNIHNLNVTQHHSNQAESEFQKNSLPTKLEHIHVPGLANNRKLSNCKNAGYLGVQGHLQMNPNVGGFNRDGRQKIKRKYMSPLDNNKDNSNSLKMQRRRNKTIQQQPVLNQYNETMPFENRNSQKYKIKNQPRKLYKSIQYPNPQQPNKTPNIKKLVNRTMNTKNIHLQSQNQFGVVDKHAFETIRAFSTTNNYKPKARNNMTSKNIKTSTHMTNLMDINHSLKSSLILNQKSIQKKRHIKQKQKLNQQQIKQIQKSSALLNPKQKQKSTLTLAALQLSPKQKRHQQKMQTILSHFDQQKLFKRICVYSKQRLKNSIRVYRQDLQAVLINRYGKDRITPYLDTQYIQDYNSIYKSTQELLKFSQEQVLVFTFLIFDQNRDGLITPEDILNLIGIKNQYAPINPLIMEDIYQIIKYLKKQYFMNSNIKDQASSQYQFLVDQSITLMKLRIINYKKTKKKQIINGYINRQSRFLSKNLRQHLYTLQNQQELQKINKKAKRPQNILINMFQSLLKNQKNSLQNQMNPEDTELPIFFSINFQSFKGIFSQKIPKLFLDFVYVYSGIQVPDLSYLQIDSSVLIKKVQERQQQIQEPPFQIVKKQLHQMKKDTKLSTQIYRTIRR